MVSTKFCNITHMKGNNAYVIGYISKLIDKQIWRYCGAAMFCRFDPITLLSPMICEPLLTDMSVVSLDFYVSFPHAELCIANSSEKMPFVKKMVGLI